MIEQIMDFIQDWHKMPEIMEYANNHGIKPDGRRLRREFAEFNKKYEEGNTELFLAHSNAKGYKLTSDPEEIKASLNDDRSRAMKLLQRNYRCMKTLSEKNQLSLEDTEAQILEIVMKNELL